MSTLRLLVASTGRGIRKLMFCGSRILVLVVVIGAPLLLQPPGPPPQDDPTECVQAAASGNAPAFRRVLARGVDPSLDYHHGYTPLMLAAQSGQCETARILLDAGADPNQLSSSGQTALSIAAGWGHERVVELLLSRGALTAVQPSPAQQRQHIHHVPPLVCAARSGMSSPRIIQRLIQAGADVNVADDEGTTPIVAAKNAGRDDLVDAISAADKLTRRD